MTFYRNNDVADEYITNKEKREKERREKVCKELVETSFDLYGDEEDYGIDDLKEDRMEKSQTLLELCETLQRSRVRIDEYNEIFEDIIRTVNTIVRMDIEIERRSKSRATLQSKSVDDVARGCGPPGQVPISAEASQ